MTQTDFVAAKANGGHYFKPTSRKARAVVRSLNLRQEKDATIPGWYGFPAEFGRAVVKAGKFDSDSALADLTVRPAIDAELDSDDLTFIHL